MLGIIGKEDRIGLISFMRLLLDRFRWIFEIDERKLHFFKIKVHNIDAFSDIYYRKYRKLVTIPER